MNTQAIAKVVGHSAIGASSMYRWSKCPGSVALSEGIVQETSAYAEEGTKAHEVASDWLNGKAPSPDMDEEMVAAVKVYVDLIKEKWDEINHVDDKMFIEHGFELSAILPGLFGTADCVIYDAKNKILNVYDYKHGAGIPVYPENNPQLMYYGLGALISANLPVKTVAMHIVQPRCDVGTSIRSWSIPAIDLMEFAADLKMYALKTKEKNAPIIEGDHCKFCPAVRVCPAVAEKRKLASKADFKDETFVKTVTPDQLADYLDGIPALEAWISAVTAHAYQAACQGKGPTGYKIVPKRAMRKWVDVDQALSKISSAINPNVVRECMTDPELKSPAQVEKILGKANAPLIESLTFKVSSGDKLVKDSAPGEAITKQSAKMAFTDEAASALLS